MVTKQEKGMYTKVGRILGKQEAQAFYDMIRGVINTPQADSLSLQFKNSATGGDIVATWSRAAPNQGDWDSLSVVYKNDQRNDEDDELFDNHHDFAEAYDLKAV
jgi:hypothetical protein